MGTVNIPSLNCKWTCPANRWLDKKEGDKQVECDVYPTLVEETYVDIVYEEVKVADLDTLQKHTDEKEGTTVSYCEDKDGKHVVVEETTTTTTSHEHIRTKNNGDVPAEEVVTCEDAGEEIVQCEEVAEVESCDDAFLDQLVDDTADVSITTTTTTTTDSQHEEVISCEVVPEVESSPSVDLIDKESDV